MHQQTRPSPRLTSPASSPQTNPARTNNPREPVMAARPRAGSAASGRGYEPPASPAVDTAPGSGPTAESFKKLDQIIQNFHTKAASVITESRMNLKSVSATKGSGSKKINKWFQLDTEDFEDFKEDLRIWRTCSALDNRPPPLIIETYLDTSRLTSSQSLVIVDENGKRWDVMEALNSSDSSDDNPNRVMRRNTDVVLERWRIELKVNSATGLDEFGPILPTIYKKIIVFFRSLHVTARVLPAWKTSQQALNKSVHPALEPRCRILAGDPSSRGVDRLRHPLHDGHGEVVTDYLFADLEVPVGRLVASVTYRNECSFRIDDAESLLSSRFMGVDENFFKPSMPQRTHNRRDDVEVGSLPSHSRGTGLSELRQTYGSLSTFHGEGALGTSPISALKAVRPPGSDTSSPPGSRPASFQPNPPNSLPVRPTMRGFTGGGVRRPSVSFQPFKAGSLSGSPIPRTLDSESPASPSSASRVAAALSQPRNRTSLTAGMPASLRGGPPSGDTLVGSPRPVARLATMNRAAVDEAAYRHPQRNLDRAPIAPHNPNSTAAYSTSTNYAPDDQYKQHNASQGAPQSSHHQPSQPQYHSYQPPSAPPGQDHYGSAPSQAPPPIPTGAAPSAPAPLQPAGSAYDTRQGLPSQTGTSPQPQYKAYVPPGGPPPNEGPSAPPGDYYRQPGVY
ncbi:hypothetical protein BN1723_016290 [Verticillium longisporum]|uniref:Autophagy-related protein 13 n=1 Tax=Verticillium longisporum TaxID=100787 RepID=A0A0G4NC11_VERLO|nr:hypothetical protein BN1723_016290 [Verticillium longisporum]